MKNSSGKRHPDVLVFLLRALHIEPLLFSSSCDDASWIASTSLCAGLSLGSLRMHGRVSAIGSYHYGALALVYRNSRHLRALCYCSTTKSRSNLLANLADALCRLCELPKSDTRKEPLCIYFAEPGGDSQGRWNYYWQTITSST